MEANKLREFEEKCRKHDWTYDWSEDSVTWDKGAAERTELNKLFDAFEGIDRLDAIRIWNTYAPDLMRRPFPKSIYLSGKITGLTPIEASKKFSEVERTLADIAKVVNPYEIGLSDEHQWISEGVGEKSVGRGTWTGISTCFATVTVSICSTTGKRAPGPSSRLRRLFRITFRL